MGKNKYKTLPIGTTFTYKGNTFRVCQGNNCYYPCDKCAFNRANCCFIKHTRGYCCPLERTDSAQVYYKQIDNKIMNKDDNNANANIIRPLFNTDNSLNDLHIACPKGYVIDTERSNLSRGIIKFKKYNITLKDIYEDNYTEYARNLVIIKENTICDKLLSIAELIDIANYYNKDWKPNWESLALKFSIGFNPTNCTYTVNGNSSRTFGNILFKRSEDAQAVIDNPNFRNILDNIYKY